MLNINKIYNIDCIDGMRLLDDNFIDLVLTSPPYDNLRDYKGFSFDFYGVANEIFRVLSVGGILVWVIGDSVVNGSETGSSFRQALYFTDLGLNLHDTMIYEKAGTPFPSRNRYAQAFEYMFVFSKGRPKTVNLIKDKKNIWGGKSTFGNSSNRQKDGSIVSSGKRIINEFGTRTNIWRYANGFGFGQSSKLAYGHPATFPEKLAEDHILSWSNANDLILDPFMGSGTVARMAKKNNRNFIGFEISKEYCELAEIINEHK